MIKTALTLLLAMLCLPAQAQDYEFDVRVSGSVRRNEPKVPGTEVKVPPKPAWRPTLTPGLMVPWIPVGWSTTNDATRNISTNYGLLADGWDSTTWRDIYVAPLIADGIEEIVINCPYGGNSTEYVAFMLNQYELAQAQGLEAQFLDKQEFRDFVTWVRGQNVEIWSYVGTLQNVYPDPDHRVTAWSGEIYGFVDRNVGHLWDNGARVCFDAAVFETTGVVNTGMLGYLKEARGIHRRVPIVEFLAPKADPNYDQWAQFDLAVAYANFLTFYVTGNGVYYTVNEPEFPKDVNVYIQFTPNATITSPAVLRTKWQELRAACPGIKLVPLVRYDLFNQVVDGGQSANLDAPEVP